MPVGVDRESVRMDVAIERKPRSVLFLGRLDEPKRPHLLLEALGILARRGVQFSAAFVGGPTDPHSSLPAKLQNLSEKLGISDRVSFVGTVPNTETFRYYRSHTIFINCSPSGMLDKTTFKAIASGCLILSASGDLGEFIDKRFIYRENDPAHLAEQLERLLTLSSSDAEKYAAELQEALKNQDVGEVARRLIEEMQ